MKKMIAIFTAMVLMLALFGCEKNVETTNENWTCACGPEDTAFTAQYIRTNGTLPDAQYPIVTVICSREALEAYYAEHSSYYSMESFLSACEKYDDTYFASKQLVLIVLAENSGSVSHKVTSVRSVGGCRSWEINIQRIVPGPHTTDLAIWHILVEVEGSHEIYWERTANVTIETVDASKE